MSHSPGWTRTEVHPRPQDLPRPPGRRGITGPVSGCRIAGSSTERRLRMVALAAANSSRRSATSSCNEGVLKKM